MIKTQLQILILTASLGISGCGNTMTSSVRAPLALNQTNVADPQPDSDSTSLAVKPENDVDVYETKYILCDQFCTDKPIRAAGTTTVATWGKPTEIGFIYPEQFYPQSMAFNPRKKITYNGMTITNLQAQLVIKSRGVLPPLDQPLKVAKFTPLSTLLPMFFPEGFNVPLMAEAKGSVRTVNIKILSVRKLSLAEANVYIKKAKNPPNLATIGAIESSVYGEVQKLAAYYEFYKNKPDIKPQQVEKISSEVNAKPQLIQVKKW